ncbi:hypothetical protein [Thiohalocapsa sp.]|uniref:hypothetical protein n=1 Tax=Thiohalocapsa sp. TaxID=2497641 RepID=UPI0025E6E8A3|nr:hypothetical protein [Thiohalocapsa sp.]
MGKHKTQRLIVTTLAAALLLGVHGAASAADCKGMEKQACEKNEAQCSWVDGYTRSDGVKVSGHCRKKPSKKSSS